MAVTSRQAGEDDDTGDPSARRRGGGARARAAGRLAVLVGLAALAAGWGCDDGAAGPAEPAPDAEAAPTTTSVLSRDGIVAAHLPVDLVPFAFADAMAGTSLDGGYRVYVRHLAEAGLVKAAGAVREDLVGRGWEVEGERHFETAVEVRLTKGTPPHGAGRVAWVVARQGRIVLCEGIASEAHAARLDEPLRRQCQRLEVSPLE